MRKSGLCHLWFWSVRKMLFKKYQNKNTENYLKAPNFVDWLMLSWVKQLSLEGVSTIANKIWLKEVHNIANKCLEYVLYKTSSTISVNHS